MRTLIITPNKTEMCGMHQLAKDLANQLKADIQYKGEAYELNNYDQVITFLYPCHLIGWEAKKLHKKWICYDQGVPPVTRKNFPNIFRRLYMRWFTIVNNMSKEGADEYWDVTKKCGRGLCNEV